MTMATENVRLDDPIIKYRQFFSQKIFLYGNAKWLLRLRSI